MSQSITKNGVVVLIPFNPTNSHWILIVINIERKTIAVLDPLVTDTVWTGTSTCKGFQVGMDIMKLKFNIDFQDVKKVNTLKVQIFAGTKFRGY